MRSASSAFGEINSLRAENKQLKKEIDILRAALAAAVVLFDGGCIVANTARTYDALQALRAAAGREGD
jgi:hypothetical protein